jgi:hypothetical protein
VTKRAAARNGEQVGHREANAIKRSSQHSAGLGRGDLLLTKIEQGETEKNQDEPSPQKTEDSD